MKWNSISAKSKILIGISAPLILLVALGVIAITSIANITYTSGWVNHTYNVLGKAQDVVSSAVDMETGMRGYLLAGKEEFLDPYKQGRAEHLRRIAGCRRRSTTTRAGRAPRRGRDVLREWQKNGHEPTIALRREIGDRQDHERHGQAGRRGARQELLRQVPQPDRHVHRREQIAC